MEQGPEHFSVRWAHNKNNYKSQKHDNLSVSVGILRTDFLYFF